MKDGGWVFCSPIALVSKRVEVTYFSWNVNQISSQRLYTSLRSKRSFSTKRTSKRFSANWPRGSWGKRLRERLQEDPLVLKNPFPYERGLLIGAAQSQWLTGDKSGSKIFLLSFSVTKAMVEDVEGFESCVEAERIGSLVLHWKGKKNCQCAISLTV